MTLFIETSGQHERFRPVPSCARGWEACPPWSEDLTRAVCAIAPFAAPETGERIADAVSLRGAELVRALISRFSGDVDEALAAFEDYAGAFESLADFGENVAAERCGCDTNLAHLPEAYFEKLARSLIAAGDAFALRLGRDLHLFWRV